MKIKIMNEEGYDEALIGLGLSYGLWDTKFKTYTEQLELAARVERTAVSLSIKEGGHNKFLESIQVWLDVTAPRYWWSEADTYRVGETKQSESTMHTLLKKPITQSMFEEKIPEALLTLLETHRLNNDFVTLKNILPEGFLQRRIWNMNYKVLRNILSQRKDHRLEQWRTFCYYIYDNIGHPEYFRDIFSSK